MRSSQTIIPVSITGWTRAYLFSLRRCLIDAELDESGARHGDTAAQCGTDTGPGSGPVIRPSRRTSRTAPVMHGATTAGSDSSGQTASDGAAMFNFDRYHALKLAILVRSYRHIDPSG